MEIQDDAVEYVLKHPGRFLNVLPPRGADLAGRVAHEAALMGATSVSIRLSDGWWVVSADIDWLAHSEFHEIDFFYRIVPFPENGANSHRAELLLTAFAESLATICDSRPTVIKGDYKIDIEAIAPQAARVVAYRMPAASQ
jgi:hypothetical protein